MTDFPASEALIVEVQNALSESESSDPEEPPSSAQLIKWARCAYSAVSDTSTEVTIRITGVKEITELNSAYRGKDKPTNVLSFPVEMELDFTAAEFIDDPSSQLTTPARQTPAILGDIVICHSVVLAEAAEQGKSSADHYAHMVTHGVLHLCGFDHQDDATANAMELLETKVLASYGVANPYSH